MRAHSYGALRGRWVPSPGARSAEFDELVVLHFNVWFDSTERAARAQALSNVLERSSADVIGLQEVTPCRLSIVHGLVRSEGREE